MLMFSGSDLQSALSVSTELSTDIQSEPKILRLVNIADLTTYRCSLGSWRPALVWPLITSPLLIAEEEFVK